VSAAADPVDPALLERLAAQFRRAQLASGASIRSTAAFSIYLWPEPDPFYRNVAVPIARPTAWPMAIGEMRQLFAAAARRPRLEFFAELWPELPAALEQAGIGRHATREVMVVERPPVVADPPAALVELAADAPVAQLGGFLAAQAEAYASPIPWLEAEIAQLRQALRRRSTRAVLIEEAGRAVAGACLIGIDREAELAGVWTMPAARRRGLGRACCAALLSRFFADGGRLVWLAAGGADSGQLYAGLGFRPVGTQCEHAA
jgi:ribosomal protein S18 acetylase RimI-like enzyme